jgi:hypothetical protein
MLTASTPCGTDDRRGDPCGATASTPCGIDDRRGDPLRSPASLLLQAPFPKRPLTLASTIVLFSLVWYTFPIRYYLMILRPFCVRSNFGLQGRGLERKLGFEKGCSSRVGAYCRGRRHFVVWQSTELVDSGWFDWGTGLPFIKYSNFIGVVFLLCTPT